MHFTGVLGTSALAGDYVTRVCVYTNIHICEHTRCRLYTCVYMYICVYMHAYAYGCVCASMIFVDTLRLVPATESFYSAKGICSKASSGAVDEESRRAGKTCCLHKASSFQALKSVGFR